MNMQRRISKAIRDSGKKKAEIARIVGVSTAAVTQWTSRETKSLKAETLMALAAATGKAPQWLATGEGPEEATAQSRMSPLIGTQVPVVSLATAVAVSLGKTPLPATTAGEWRPCPVEHGPRTYYIRVPETDDSMVSTNPLERSYPPGSFVLIDPDYVDPTGKRAILALVEGQETPILRRAGVDAGEPYLWSTNERSRPIYKPFTQLGTARGKWED